MNDSRTLTIVLAGGQGSRMDVLTERRAKPALPFAGVYRLIDFPMSNARNSGLDDVWVVAQYETQTVSDILANGRPWDLDRTHGGFRLVTPEQSRDDDGTWHEGNADALYQCRELIRAHGADVLLVLSADHVYRLDYGEVVAQHRDRESIATIVTTQVPIDQATHHAVVDVNEDGQVTGLAYKPDDPSSGVVAAEIFVYDAAMLLEALETLAGADEAGLDDFGDQLLPYLIEQGRVDAFPLEGYWKDLGRPETYFKAHMDLLDDQSDLELDDDRWPIFTLDHQRMPARLEAGSQITNALVSPGCVIHGTVERSVLGPGTYVGPGAVVRDAVILHETMVGPGAEIRYAIVDRGVTVEENASVCGACGGSSPTTDELVLVGAGATVNAGSEVDPGTRIPAADSLTDLH